MQKACENDKMKYISTKTLQQQVTFVARAYVDDI